MKHHHVKHKYNRIACYVFLFVLYLFSVNTLRANNLNTFLVLDVEVEDYTKIIQDKQEIDAIGNLKSNLADKLRGKNFSAVAVDKADWVVANKSVGYIFNSPTFAEELGKKYDSEYVIIGKISKPSNLFVYLIIQILDVKQNVIVAKYQVEVKGQWVTFMNKGINRLVEKILNQFKA